MPSAIRSSRRLTPSEAQISRLVRDYLDAERIFWVRQNAGAQVLTDAQGRRRMIRMARAGAADILALVKVEVCTGCAARMPKPLGPGSWKSRCCARQMDGWWVPLHLELKTVAGHQSPAQHEEQRRVEGLGHMYRIIQSAEDLKAALEEARR